MPRSRIQMGYSGEDAKSRIHTGFLVRMPRSRIQMGYSDEDAKSRIHMGFSIRMPMLGIQMGYSGEDAKSRIHTGFSVRMPRSGIQMGYSSEDAKSGIHTGFSVKMPRSGIQMGHSGEDAQVRDSDKFLGKSTLKMKRELLLFPNGFLFLLVLSSCIAFLPCPSQAYNYPPIVNGLSFSYYKSTCPQVELLVRSYLKEAFKKNIGLAAGLLRLHFHDCFVQGCDGSILLDGSAGGPSEKQAPPNLTLRPAAFNAINEIQAIVTKACGSVVSCSDIAALSARDSVSWVCRKLLSSSTQCSPMGSGGPDYLVPLGRRDGLTFATMATVLKFLPSPNSNVSFLIISRAGPGCLKALGKTISYAPILSFHQNLNNVFSRVVKN
ncbi:hypothetical protein ZIOFF_068117 [Zingiber officinale]|uniref:Peroxidase n=1 Tax=Zingiber officinale TaxID=94328 RepID=A0A8J5BL79_ZINOF|nr:hypothetical protein ZIOFF_068117 [Zingiber officinale]